MIDEPKCHARKCRHLIGIAQFDEDESTEIAVCKAFPTGIPDAIAWGNDKHTSPHPGDHGIQYEREEDE